MKKKKTCRHCRFYKSISDLADLGKCIWVETMVTGEYKPTGELPPIKGWMVGALDICHWKPNKFERKGDNNESKSTSTPT